MNALRSGSAFARRSLATPPVAPLSSSSRLLSSSFTSFSTSQRSLSSASLPRTHRISASSRWTGSTPSLYLTQTRTMAIESKIKVVNPVVELDGDEVWSEPLPFYILVPEPSSRGVCHKPAMSHALSGAFSSCPSFNAGKYGGAGLDTCVIGPTRYQWTDPRLVRHQL